MRYSLSASLLIASSTILAAAVSGAACSAPADEGASSESDIVGGATAGGAKLAAIGSLGEPERGARTPATDGGGSPEPTYSSFCTATLVAPKLVVTAKHCVRRRMEGGFYFKIGGDGARPRRAVKVAKVDVASMGEGGFVQLGADVSLLELEESIDDVAPLKMLDAHLPREAVGSRLSAVGFGIRDRQRTLGKRLAGTLTLQHVDGPIFGTFASADEMIAHAQREAPEAYRAEWDDERLRNAFTKELLPDYEAFLGLGDGDSQPCSGDSGGPLVARIGDELVVTAVVSGSLKYADGGVQPCSVFGEVYATFGANVQAMFDEVSARTGQPLQRVSFAPIFAGSPAQLPAQGEPRSLADGGVEPADRCRGFDAAGVCDQGTVNRCIAESEAPPRAVRIDCSLLLSTCVVKDGAAQCAD